MSTVDITISTQPPPPGAFYGAIVLQLQIQGTPYDLSLSLDPLGGYKKFKIAPYIAEFPGTDVLLQAQEYANSMNRDYVNVGGVGNISASVVNTNGTVRVTSTKGTFHNGVYTGNHLDDVTFSYNNTLQEDPKTFEYEKTGSGDCTNEQYRTLSATGGTPPYRLTLGGVNVVSGWDGDTDETFDLARSGTFNGGLYDSLGALIKTVQINPTKNINASHFEAVVTPYAGYSDIQINTLVSVSGTTPLEYNLLDSDGAAAGWQSSNIFGGYLPGNYTFKVRDVYGCEVSKTVVIPDVEAPSQLDREDYFAISEYNSLSFYNEVEFSDDVRKNYNNTPSEEERVGAPKRMVYGFPAGRTIRTQFKSSYSHHAMTLYRKDQSRIPIQFFMIQQNLGIKERVDCEVFKVQETWTRIDGKPIIIGNGMGVYFNGGDKYEPDTNTVIDDSPYLSGLPGWAQVGNFVTIDGEGTFEIAETDLYDEDLDVVYFRIDANFNAGTYVAQSIWDRHPYNVFRGDFDSSLISEKGAYVKIEPGTEENGALIVDQNRVHRSEWFALIKDTSKYIKWSWSAFRNIGHMLFLDNIECEMWVKGRIRPFSDTSSEFDDADDRTRSIDQQSLLRMRGFFPLLSVRQWRKLDLVGAIGNRGKVFAEGMELVRISSSEQEEQGVTNLSNYTVEMAFAGESTAISQEDPVYDLSTGSENSPSTGLEEVTGWEAANFRLVTEEGEFVKVTQDGVEKYIDIE